LNDGNADPICRLTLRITKIGFEAIDAPDEAVAAPTETSRHDAGCLAFAAQDNSENLSVGIFHCRFDTPVAPRIMTGCLNDSVIFSRTWAFHEAWAMPWCQPSSTMRS
jgi:hypothetical protein